MEVDKKTSKSMRYRIDFNRHRIGGYARSHKF